MTDREKIIDVLNKNFTQEVKCTPVYTAADGKELALPQELCNIFNDIVTQAVIPYFADALIAAGIGDVKETQHRTEVTEWACRIATDKIYDYCYEEAIAQAERELAEEKKDDERPKKND